MATRQKRSRLRGFTMIEAIIAIVLIGILGGMVAVFIRAPLQAYFDTANRAVLTDIADGAIRRVARDVASALPNSLRTETTDSKCFELLPVLAGGRYRAEQYYDVPSSTLKGDILKFTGIDNSFDVLGEVRMSSLSGTTNKVVIYNLGINDAPGGINADAYAGGNTSTISNATTTRVDIDPKKFPLTSPGKSFQVIPNNSVAYYCSGTSPNKTLYRTTPPISSSNLTCSSLVGGTALATNVSNCKFDYLPAVNQRAGILSILLSLELNGETVTLYDQVMVNNAP